ncbi:carboxypeptidase-like regulatory domain-containing protein [Vasconcelosia minhoensis]|nr:carboxypeptidase-like regulatory domain-containing protein [Romeria gracilis]
MESRFSLKNVAFWLSALLVAMAGGSPKAMAHKTELEYRKAQAVQVEAVYSGGQPMSNAQVTVYAPDNPQAAWRTGTTDEQGRFTFLPDQSGTWEVRVRKAGHGSFLTVSVEEGETESAETEPASFSGSGWLSAGRDTSTTNQVLYSAAGAWGFFGTALFLVRRRKDG